MLELAMGRPSMGDAFHPWLSQRVAMGGKREGSLG